ncbi:MAG TPA: hypothetical protein VF111_13905, partial [Thermoanaerobaculia bacterium]
RLYGRFPGKATAITIGGLAATSHQSLIAWLHETIDQPGVERTFLNALPGLLNTLDAARLGDVFRAMRPHLSNSGKEELDEFAQDESVLMDGVVDDEVAAAEAIQHLLEALSELQQSETTETGRRSFDRAAPVIEGLIERMRPTIGLPIAHAYLRCARSFIQRNDVRKAAPAVDHQRALSLVFGRRAANDYVLLREGAHLRPHQISRALLKRERPS